MSVIAVKFSARWQSPVYIGEGALLSGTVTGPGDALRHMKTFRHKSAPNYRRALDLCHLALTNGVHPEICRSHFIAACADEDARSSNDD